MKQFSGLIFVLFAVLLFGANATSFRNGQKKVDNDRNNFFVSDQGLFHKDDNFGESELSFLPIIEIQKKPVQH